MTAAKYTRGVDCKDLFEVYESLLFVKATGGKCFSITAKKLKELGASKKYLYSAASALGLQEMATSRSGFSFSHKA